MFSRLAVQLGISSSVPTASTTISGIMLELDTAFELDDVDFLLLEEEALTEELEPDFALLEDAGFAEELEDEDLGLPFN